MTRHTIREELSGVIAIIGFIWCVYFIGYILGLHLEEYGVTPRRLHGLVGIPAAPFLHANMGHLISNTVPLFVLLVLMAGSRANTWVIVTSIVQLGGALLWLFGWFRSPRFPHRCRILSVPLHEWNE